MGLEMEGVVLKQIIEEAKLRGHSEVRIRDVAYALMKVRFKDSLIPYTICFGTPENEDVDVSVYDKKDSTKFLVRWFEKDLAPKKETKMADVKDAILKAKEETDTDGSISFKENRAGIENQLREIAELKSITDKSDVKTMALLQKTEADLRVKLNDKFGADEKEAQDYIITPKVYDFVCPHTRRECYQINKKEAMEKWHLIPDPNYKEE